MGAAKCEILCGFGTGGPAAKKRRVRDASSIKTDLETPALIAPPCLIARPSAEAALIVLLIATLPTWVESSTGTGVSGQERTLGLMEVRTATYHGAPISICHANLLVHMYQHTPEIAPDTYRAPSDVHRPYLDIA